MPMVAFDEIGGDVEVMPDTAKVNMKVTGQSASLVEAVQSVWGMLYTDRAGFSLDL